MHSYSFALACLVMIFSGLAFADQSLLGKWGSTCRKISVERSHYSDLNVSSTNLSHNYRYFYDSQCQQKDYRLLELAHYATSLNPNNAVLSLDLILDRLLVTFYRQETVDGVNEIELCEYDDWQVNIPKDILGKKCPEGEVGDEFFDIVQIMRGRLYFGLKSKELDGTTEAKRPNQINYDEPYYEMAKSVSAGSGMPPNW